MPILNYTTKVQATNSVFEITKLLTRHGATKVMTINDPVRRIPIGLVFEIGTVHGNRGFKLLAKIEGVLLALKRAKVTKAYQTHDHACRVAWRILRDRIAVQMAEVEAGMISVEEVMLPHLLGDDQRTLWETMESRRLALPRA